MILGVDLDNTTVCYDGLFHAAAVERELMPPDGPTDKRGVRRWFVERDRENDFTLLQGYVYGPGLKAARPYPGALECLRHLRAAGVKVYVVSHKTKVPQAGPPHDLHRAARDWLEDNGFHVPGLLDPDEVFLEETLESKAGRVAALGCTHFLDDLETFLTHPLFPSATERMLFRPPGGDDAGFVRDLTVVSSWREAAELLGRAIDG